MSPDEQELYYELESHIWDIYYESVDNGMDSGKALKYALMQIGGEEIRLNTVTQKRKKYKLFVLMLLVAVTIFSQLFLFKDYGYIEKELIYGIGVLGVGIFIIVNVRLINFKLIDKAFFFLWVTLIFADMLITLWLYIKYGGVSSNYKIIVVFFYLLFWGKEGVKIEKIKKITRFVLVILTGGTILLTFFSSRKQAFVLLVLGYILIIFYTENEKISRILAQSCLVTIGCFSACGMFILGCGKEYQKGRIMAYILARKDDILLYRQQNAVAALFNRIDLKEAGFEYDMYYYWAELASSCSVLFCVIVLALYLLLAAKLLKRISMYPKNNTMGYVFLLLYFFRVIYSLAMNLGIVPITSVTLPFLTFDIWTFLYDCLWIGYLLNTYFTYNILGRNRIV